MSLRLPGSRSSNERSPDRESVSPRVVVEGQYPSIVVSPKSYLTPGCSSPLPPMIPVPIASTSYQQLLTDLANLRANNTLKSSTQSAPPLNPMGLQWSNLSIEKFYEIKTLLGLDPDFVLTKSQGFALWLKPRGRYYSFEVRDHRNPFVVRFPKQLREKTIKHLHKATPSAWYERNAALIGVQTDSIDQAVLILALIKAYDQGQRLPEEIRKEADRERADSTRLESPVRDALERYIMSEN